MKIVNSLNSIKQISRQDQHTDKPLNNIFKIHKLKRKKKISLNFFSRKKLSKVSISHVL